MLLNYNARNIKWSKERPATADVRIMLLEI